MSLVIDGLNGPNQPNQSMKANRRYNFALTAERALGRGVHARPLLPAAVAYFCR
jgi:hypothetical protein